MAPEQTEKFRTAFLVIFYHFDEGQRRQLWIDFDAVSGIC